jgi:hypothetical protein
LRRAMLAGLCILAAACGPFDEFQVKSYATHEAAQADRLFERGWVPNVLPQGAGPIVEAHDLDTNARCSKSALPPGGFAEVSEALVALGFRPSSMQPQPLPFAKCPFHLDEALSSGASLLVAPGQHAVVTESAFYFWSHP